MGLARAGELDAFGYRAWSQTDSAHGALDAITQGQRGVPGESGSPGTEDGLQQSMRAWLSVAREWRGERNSEKGSGG